MKPHTLLAFMLLSLWFGATTVCHARQGKQLRLTTYNIHHGRGMDNQIDYQRIANLIRQSRADVVAVQEVDSATQRTGNRYSLGEIAKGCKMHATFAAAIPLQGGKYGIGILSKKRPLSWHSIALPGAEEPRALLVAEFKHYVVACTHLSLTESDLMESISLIVVEARKWQKPFILMGDLNADPQSEFYKVMQRHFTFINNPKEPTFPSETPKNCIDHIAVFNANADRIQTICTQVGSSIASDHNPLHATIRLKK